MADTKSEARAKADADAKTRMEADKKRLGEEREARQKQMAEREKNRGTPTPTQEEADLAKLGHHPELAKDGSPEDPNVGFGKREREMTSGESGRTGYETRQSTARGTTHNPSHTRGE
jgi:hypothetical protein